MLLCEPGSGPFKGARLTDYSGLPADLQMVVVIGEDDYVVGDEFGRLVFQTATARAEISSSSGAAPTGDAGSAQHTQNHIVTTSISTRACGTTRPNGC